jgi:glycosyltransferase involved in cell wall biosynthesis
VDSQAGIHYQSRSSQAPHSYQALVTDFGQAMQKLIDHPDMAKAMGTAGRERAVRDFDWQPRIDAMVGIYDILVKKPVLVRS